MRHPGEAAQGRLHRRAIEPCLQAGSHRQQHVLQVVGTGHGQGIGGQDGAAAALALQPHAPVFDPESGQDAGRQLLARSRRHPHGMVPARCSLAQVRIVTVEDAHVGALQQLALDRPVVVQRAVAFKVVGGEGGPDPHPRRHPRTGLDLITAHLHHQPVGQAPAGLLPLQHQLGGGGAHIAGHRRVDVATAEQVAEQMGDGGLAVGAGHGHPGQGPAGLPGRLQLSLHQQAGMPKAGQLRVVPGNARAHHHRTHGGGEGEDGGGTQGRIEFHPDPCCPQGFGPLLKCRTALALQHADGPTLGLQQTRRADP